jgi:hypothetical protein
MVFLLTVPYYIPHIVPDSSTPIGRLEYIEEHIHEEETFSIETAQLAIDYLRSEAAADDQTSHSNFKENLKVTETALEKIHGGIEFENFDPLHNLTEAQRMIHAYPELEPYISENSTKI